MHTANCQTWGEVCGVLEECEAHTFIEKYLVSAVFDTVLGTGEITITKLAKTLPSWNLYSKELIQDKKGAIHPLSSRILQSNWEDKVNALS